jgi:hypothetical protein
MGSFGKLRHVVLVRTDVSEDLSYSIIRVTRMGELGTLTITLTSVFLRSALRLLVTATFLVHRFFSPDDGGAKFLRNVGSYKSHTA